MAAELEFPLIILAAGKGARAGGAKGLIEYNGRPWISEQLRLCHAVGVKSSVIVLGYQHVDYLKVLAREKTDFVINAAPERGQFSSLQCGARWALAAKAAAAFVLPVDVPCPGREVWQALVDNLSTSTQACVPEVQKHGGHPVLLVAPLLEKIASLDVDASNARLDILLHELPAATVRRVPVDDITTLMNINSAKDWASHIAKAVHDED